MKTRPVVALLLAAACGSAHSSPPPPAASTSSSSGNPPASASPIYRHYTFRAMTGISMGGMGASFIGSSHPDLFDAIGSLGGPMDFAYLLHSLEDGDAGGFCTLGQLQALLEEDPTGKILNDPKALTCMHAPAPQVPYEHTEDFNHWRYTDNGGNFDRDSYLDLLEDLDMAFGNALTYNPKNPFFAPGVDDSVWARGADLCTHPFVIPGTLHGGTAPVYNAEYNPTGAYDAILFCDGQRPIWYCADDPTTEIDWCQAKPGETSFPQDYCEDRGGALQADRSHNEPLFLQWVGSHDPCYPSTRPVSIALAIDLNGNGVRDYGEPLVINANERWQDVGTDGCPDPLEDGKGGCVSDPSLSPYDPAKDPDPNGDDYDPLKNPLGTENDWRYEPGEPFEDNGLDGVPNTHDYGEGNGVFDVNPDWQNMFAVDARTNIRERWPAIDADATHLPQIRRVDYYLDGGIRDVFNFGVNSLIIRGLLAALLPDDPAQLFLDFSAWPTPNTPFTDNTFNPDMVDWSKVSRDAMTLYGTANPTPEQLAAGDGDHVGTIAQAVDRFQALYYWLAHRWDKTGVSDPGVGSNPQSFTDRQFYGTYVSQALGGVDRDFALVVPPGYNSPENAQARYPVVYIGHGYGMDPLGMMGVDVIEDPAMQTGDLRKMIVVFPSGRCCYTDPTTGDHACTDYLPDGTQRGPPWVRECNSGTFYVNSQGGPDGPPRAYLDAFLELVKYVDQNYRTLAGPDGNGLDVKVGP